MPEFTFVNVVNASLLLLFMLSSGAFIVSLVMIFFAKKDDIRRKRIHLTVLFLVMLVIFYSIWYILNIDFFGNTEI